MDDALDAGVLLEHALKGFHVAAVHLFKGWADASYLLNTVNDVGIGIGKVVYNHYLIACLLQFYGGMASDESGAACYKNCLFHYIKMIRC